MTTPRPQPPSCPRCGYDLSGAIASWQETCPLATTCTECGLSFELRLVLNETLRSQTDFFEASTSRTGRKLRKTVMTALRPWRFWRWVVMEHPPRSGWMALGVLVGMIYFESVCAALACVLIGARIFIEQFFFHVGTGSYASGTRALQVFLQPWEVRTPGRRSYLPSTSLVILALLTQILMRYAILVAPYTLRKAKVRDDHLVRIAGWSFVSLPILLAIAPLLQLLLDAINAIAGPASGSFPAPSIVPWHPWTWWLMPGLLLSWTFLWHAQANKSYLRLPTPWIVTLATFTIAFLAALLICLCLPGVSMDIAFRFWT